MLSATTITKVAVAPNSFARCKTEDNQQSQPQALKQEAMEQDIQADPVQIFSVVGEDTTVQTVDRKNHSHIINPKDVRGSAEERL
eukprot:10726777-Ditylum_brightwellii.AAC.1